MISTALLLYMAFAFGGVSVYFLLPHGRVGRKYVGPVLAVLALVAWLVVMSLRVVAPGARSALFYLFAAIAVVATVRVVTHRKPFYSAIYFVLTVVAVAALLILQQAEFLAVSLIIIYAGAILVTYLFLIMLAQQSGAPSYDRRAREPFAAVFAGFVLMAAIAGKADHLSEPLASARAAKSEPGASAPDWRRDARAPVQQGTIDQERPTKFASWALDSEQSGAEAPGSLRSGESARKSGNTFAIGAAVMTQYVVALQIAGVLLLISMVGAVALSRKKVPMDIPWAAPPAPLGEAGRQAEPY